MNAEALTDAAQACRESSEALMLAADDADVFLHRCPDAGAGVQQVARQMRRRAIGLRVAASFLSRCARIGTLPDLMSAIEAGNDVYVVRPVPPVVVPGEADFAPARVTLAGRVRRLFTRGGRAARKAA